MPRVTRTESGKMAEPQAPPLAPPQATASAQEITRDKIAELRRTHASVRKFAMHVPDEYLTDMEAIEQLHRSVPALLDAVEGALNECEWLRQQLAEAWAACADAEASLNAEMASRDEEHQTSEV